LTKPCWVTFNSGHCSKVFNSQAVWCSLLPNTSKFILLSGQIQTGHLLFISTGHVGTHSQWVKCDSFKGKVRGSRRFFVCWFSSDLQLW